jgi:hypothetical protein
MARVRQAPEPVLVEAFVAGLGRHPGSACPAPRFLRDARRAGLRLVTERTILPHQYFLVLRRAR